MDTGTGEFKVGDLFTVAGDTTQYVVTADLNGPGLLNYAPQNPVAFADDAAITVVADHAVNLAFHRDAIGLAIRPLANSQMELALGARIMTMTDPISGVPLRLEIRREHKRVRYSIDALWGVELLRPECAARVLG